MQRFLGFITGLAMAVGLLLAIAIYSIIGTVLPQGLATEMYLERYPSLANLIMTLQFDHVYTSVVFYLLLGLFVINLVGCTLKILPSQVRRTQKGYVMSPRANAEELYQPGMNPNLMRQTLLKQKFSILEKEDGYVASKHRFGHIGSSVTHFGIIVIIMGSIIGAVFAEEGFFNLMPGDVKSFPEYGFALRLEDFSLGFRENGTVEQYYSKVSILKADQPDKEATLWVNQPLAVNSLNFYQTSYGWASRLKIVNSSGETILAKVLRNGESAFLQDNHMTVYLYGFYPNFTITSEGQPLTMSEELKDPQYAVVLYEFGEHVGSYIVEPGQPIERGDFKISFQDSVLYTGLTYRKDFGYAFVVAGSLLMFLGLILSFYLYPKQVQVKSNSVKVMTRQNPWGMTFQVKKMIESTMTGEENASWNK